VHEGVESTLVTLSYRNYRINRYLDMATDVSACSSHSNFEERKKRPLLCYNPVSVVFVVPFELRIHRVSCLQPKGLPQPSKLPLLHKSFNCTSR
jgi:hypothetical protein